MTHDRAFLLDALRRIRDGGTVTNEEVLGTIANPTHLDEIERVAWQRLSQWADDVDIRARDPAYAEMQQKHVADALADLDALEAGYLPCEIERGDHKGWHIPIWGCLLVTMIAGAALYFVGVHLL